MVLLAVSFIAGVLTVLAPCILPLLPVIVGGSINGGTSIRRAVTVTVSLAVSVIAFTLLIKASTVLIAVPQSFWNWFSGGIVIVFGLITLYPRAWEKLPFLAKASMSSNKLLSAGYKKQSFLGDMLVGAALGPVFSTCSPTYFLVLAAVLPESITLGLVYLVAYSLGLSLALLVIAFIGQRIVEQAGVAVDPSGWFKKILGVLFLVVGLAIISGADKALQVKILDAGFFDVTKIEQKLLELVPTGAPSQKKSESAPKLAGPSETGPLTPEEKRRAFQSAPEIGPAQGYVNTDGKPITLAELRGKVVLLDIWTYSCINCQRTLPHVTGWYEKYKDQGLEIIGVHTPEFAFERVQKNVEEATQRFNIEYPVILDNEYITWDAYGNRYWPRKYLIDIDGFIVYDHIGEGAYEETERAIQKALAERNERLGMTGAISSELSALATTGEPKSRIMRSPEVYFGADRNRYLANGARGVRGPQTFSLPESPSLNNLYLGGKWDITEEAAQTLGASHIVFKYRAKDVYIVAGSDNGVDVRVYNDDVLVKTLTIQAAKLYELVSNAAHGEHVLRIEVSGRGLDAYTFTFG